MSDAISLEEQTAFRGNEIILQLQDFLDIPDDHSSTQWKFSSTVNPNETFTITTTANGVVSNYPIAIVSYGSLLELYIALDRTKDYYFQARINEGEWSEQELLDLQPRMLSSKHRTETEVTTTSTGATVSTPYPRWTESRSGNRVVITNQVYVDEPASNKPTESTQGKRTVINNSVRNRNKADIIPVDTDTTDPDTPPVYYPMTTASLTSGIAPLAVFFDTSAATDTGVVQPISSTDDVLNYNMQTYVWDFGDPKEESDPICRWSYGNTNESLQYKTRNEATGCTAAHVYEVPGTYTVTLLVTDENGLDHYYTQTITVSAFSGTTYYLSSTGSDSNNGLSVDAPVQTIAHAKTLFTAGTRLLLKRGDSFTLPSTIYMPNNSLIGAYGTGANPIIDATSGTAEYVFYISNKTNTTMQDLDLLGPNTAATTAISTLSASQVLALRISIDAGWGMGIYYGSYMYLVDCITTNSLWDSFFSSSNYLALMGNHFDTTVQGDGHNLYIDAANRGVFVSNSIEKPISSKHCLRIAANEKTSRQVTITDNYINGTTTWLAVQFGISSGSWDLTQHAENILFERNNVISTTGIPVQMVCDYRNTIIRDNDLDTGGELVLDIKGFGAGVDSGFDGPRGVWCHDNNVSFVGSDWWQDRSIESQKVYVYNNTVNDVLDTGIPPA